MTNALTAADAHRNFHLMIRTAMSAPSAAIAYPISLHGTKTTFDAKGCRVVSFAHRVGNRFNDWNTAQDAYERATTKAAKAGLGDVVSYYMIDARGCHVPRRLDGWKLRNGVPVASCACCGAVGPYDLECCDI